MGTPLTLCMLGIVWMLLTRVFFPLPKQFKVNRNLMESQYQALGPMSFEEKTVSVIALATAALWVFRKKLDLGLVTIPGWSAELPYPELIDDGTVGLTMALTLFFIPTRSRGAPCTTLATADQIAALPWHIVLLFGGGFALAEGFQTSGLSGLIGNLFSEMAGLNPLFMLATVCLTLTFLTELTSNTATIQVALPILASLAVATEVDPLLLMIPATLSASCAFMMPVATPPNAIVFGSGRITIAEMAKVGIVLNLIGIVMTTAVFYWFGAGILGVDTKVFPEWAQFVPSIDQAIPPS